MKKSDINQPPCYFDRYLNYVADIEIVDALQESLTEIDSLDLAELSEIGDAVYADEKWTIKSIFQHLVDVERILSYRALRIARNDKTSLPGFDEGVLAVNAGAEKRSLDDLIQELKVARRSTSLLFASLDDEALQRSLIVSDNQMSVLAFGFTIVGHQKHHLKIIAEKYLPLIERPGPTSAVL
jgi:DinB superfamily